MKNLIKFLFVAVLIATFGFGAKAQLPVNASAVLTANATILTALSFGTTTAVNFGNVSATTLGVVYLDPKNAASNYVGVSAANGVVPISGANKTSIRLTWPTNIELTSASSVKLYYTLAVNGDSLNVKASSIPLTLSGGHASVLTAAAGTYFLYVGGSLSGATGTPASLASQAAGTYSGTATFAVEYN